MEKAGVPTTAVQSKQIGRYKSELAIQTSKMRCDEGRALFDHTKQQNGGNTILCGYFNFYSSIDKKRVTGERLLK